MANVKISALPNTTATTLTDYVVKNDSSNTTTNNSQLKYVLGMTNVNGSNSIQSAKYLTSEGTTATTESSIAIGNGAEATSPYSIAIGYRARNENRDGGRDYYIAIGTNSRAVQGATAIGKDAFAAGANATSFGIQAETFGNGAFALGNNSISQSTNGVAIGSFAQDRTNQNGFALGVNSINYGDNSIAFGINSVSYSGSSIAMGDEAATDALRSIAIGQLSRANNTGSVAIGYSARSNHDEAYVFGSQLDSVYSATTHNKHDYTYYTTSFNVVDAGQVGGNVDIDCSAGTIFKFEMTANTTPNFTNFRDGQQIWFIVLNTTYNVPTATIAGGGSVYAKNGTISPSNNGWTKYMGTFISGDLWLDEEAGFSAV